MGDIKFPHQQENKMRHQFNDIEIRIHNVMSVFGMQRINPEYSVRHFPSFVSNMDSRKNQVGYKKAVKEINEIWSITDDVND